MAVVGIKKGRKEVTIAFLHVGSFHSRLTLRINITDATRTFSGYHSSCVCNDLLHIGQRTGGVCIHI